MSARAEASRSATNPAGTSPERRRVLITGAAGNIGRALMLRLAQQEAQMFVLGCDRRPARPAGPRQRCEVLDIRSEGLPALMRHHRINTVVHLAALLSPPPGMSRQRLQQIEVGGTRRLLDAALEAGVEQFIVTSSGAAYGYHADNPCPLRESDPLRGNPEFAYADHKRQVEELLAQYRRHSPSMRQLVLRPGTVLGPGFHNPITALFERPVVLGVVGSTTPFVFIWVDDLVACLHLGIRELRQGIFNVAGDGTIDLRDIARLLGKPFLPIPAPLWRLALGATQHLGLSRLGPEQLLFLRYRPVLCNDLLKEAFGFKPEKSSRECFLAYARSRELLALTGATPA